MCVCVLIEGCCCCCCFCKEFLCVCYMCGCV
jgi:hypothetical protein